MATLILTAVGTAVGGPIGGALGAIIGQHADQAIFAPKARHGPRLGDLSVQTSSYGTAIPKIFGALRVAGTVIWATDLVESRSGSGGGKGRPKTVSYSYSASFAVALSGRPIRDVRRIWADGKLLRGAAGDFKSATRYRFYPGSEDQPVDPLIASAEGSDQAPAFRGTTYAVFEDFQLGDYGNRIPSLTFEVEADDGPVAIGAIAEALSGGVVVSGPTPALGGYAASGDSVRSAIGALADVVPLSLSDDGEVLHIAASGGSPVALTQEEESGRRELLRRASATIPGAASIAYHDIARDYQTGLQRAVRGAGLGARTADRRALPAALNAEGAKALAEFRLAALWAGRTSARLQLGWRRSPLKPGSLVRLEGESGHWKVERWTLGPTSLRLELIRVSGLPVPDPVEASAGRPVSQPDLLHGPTHLRFLELPPFDIAGVRPHLLAAAAGTARGWRRAELMISYDDGGSWDAAGGTASPAIIGTMLSVPPARDSALFDTESSMEVELLNDGMWLESRSDEALIGGANLALVGEEVIQFGTAELLGGRRFRLGRLLRGRRGTEWAAGLHQAGENFLLLDPENLVALEAPPGSVGGTARITAAGIGDGVDGVSASLQIDGESLRPPSPVHLKAEWLAGGDLAIGWVRRSRLGWSWISGSDTPLAEEREAYRLAISGAGFERVVSLHEPQFIYTAAQQTQDGAAGPLQILVSQIGTHAASRAASLTIA